MPEALNEPLEKPPEDWAPNPNVGFNASLVLKTSAPDFPPNNEDCVEVGACIPCVTPNGFVLLVCGLACPPKPKRPNPNPKAFSVGLEAAPNP